MEFLAHVKGEKKETLQEHTELCLKYYDEIFREKNYQSIYTNIFKVLNFNKEEYSFIFKMIRGVYELHDIGKINPLFQKNKMKNKLSLKWENYDGDKHSLLSSVIYLNTYLLEIEKHYENNINLIVLCFINAYIISRHHSHINQFVNFNEEFIKTGRKLSTVLYQSGILEYIDLLIMNQNDFSKYFDIEAIDNSISYFENTLKENESSIALFTYTRLIYSTLLACDFYSTNEFMNGIKQSNVQANGSKLKTIYESSDLIKGIRSKTIEEYKELTDVHINHLRSQLFLEVEECYLENQDSNLFYLEAPTGSGKSNIAYNLSFQMAAKENRKIYYIYPFNSLVEQNYNSLKQVFGNNEEVFNSIEVINSVVPIKKNKDGFLSDEEYNALLLNRQFLNYPFILTTHVSLFKTMFNTGREDAFGFHQLINSVIVLDEIQSYRNSIWGEIISFLQTFSKLLNIKIIIMSATLPAIDLLSDINIPVTKLVRNRDYYFHHPKFKDRVFLHRDLLEEESLSNEQLWNHIEEYSLGKRIVVEFIKKSDAYEFYNFIRAQTDASCLLLTGDDNISERNRILNQISSRTLENVILVATQVVEAGLDIDMDVGYKNVSLLDNEEQFMGRINRSCLLNGDVYFFNRVNAKSIYKNDVRSNSNLLANNEEIYKFLMNKDFNQYYELVFKTLKTKQQNLMTGIQRFFDEDVLKLDMKSVEKRMTLIDDIKDNKVEVFFNRDVEINGIVHSGKEVWNKYKYLLNSGLDYTAKRIELNAIRALMNNFIYKIDYSKISYYDEMIGELYYMEDASHFIEEGKLMMDSKFKEFI